jgi:hypothetical protein
LMYKLKVSRFSFKVSSTAYGQLVLYNTNANKNVDER